MLPTLRRSWKDSGLFLNYCSGGLVSSEAGEFYNCRLGVLRVGRKDFGRLSFKWGSKGRWPHCKDL